MRQTKSCWGFAAMIAVALVLAATPGWPQEQPQNCKDLRAIWTLRLTFDDAKGVPAWGGEVVIAIGEEVLEGTMREGDIPFRKGTPGVVGMDRKAQYISDFGSGDEFTLELQSTAAYPSPPGKSVSGNFGFYRDVCRIVAGKGRFAGATGHVAQSGPFVVWFRNPEDFSSIIGLYAAELHGKICFE